MKIYQFKFSIVAGRWLATPALAMLLITGGIAQSDKIAETDGRTLYIKFGCHQCHGYEGQGGLLSGPRIAPNPLPLKGFTEILRRPYGVMPAYSDKVISDETLKIIHQYLQSISDSEATPG